jgi:hypothetical protein
MWAYRKVQCIAKKEAMERRRTLETEQEKFARTEQDRLRKQRTRAAETNFSPAKK